MRAALLAVLFLAGCISPPEKPATFTEQVAYAEVSAQAALQTIDDLTCHKGYAADGLCVDPGKPIKPAKAVELIEQLKKVRGALKASAFMPEKGGECLGEQRTPQACLQTAQSMLFQVETFLRERQK